MAKHSQTGMVTLLVTILLLVIVTITTFYLVKIGLLETRTSANNNRAKEALHHAQAGLDYGAMMYLDQGTSWADGTANSVSLANGASISVRGDISADLLTITASGASIDLTGNARIREGYGRFPLIAFGELPPLMSNGDFPPSGSFTIVANPNGGGNGVPVSAWVEESTGPYGGSWQTCNMEEFLYQGGSPADHNEQGDGFILCDTCRCNLASDKLCQATSGVSPDECADIVVQPPADGFPDTFENTFGFPGEDWASFRDSFATIVEDCDDLNASVGEQFYIGDKVGQLPLIWIEDANCDLSGQIASYEYPIILVINSENISSTGNTQFFGVLFAFTDIYTGTGGAIDLKLNANTIVYGVVLVNSDVDLGNGSFALVYSNNVLEKLSTKNSVKYGIGRRAGSWTDFN